MASNSGEVSRPTADFHPNVWGDRFLVNVFDRSQSEKDNELRVIQELVNEIRTLILPTTNKISMQQLQLIDSIQRLGVEYLFESEIEQALKALFESYDGDHWVSDNSLQSDALIFRLLRQHGYKASCNIFYKLKDDQGTFKESITSDVKGMLEFYEASHLSFHHEAILDEGRDFARSHLSKKLSSKNEKDNTALVEKIAHVLRQPYHRGGRRVEARAQISMYEKDTFHNKTLLRLAKLDFNRLQSLHRSELAEIYRWWKGLDVPRNLPFARDRVVEGYFWILGVYYEPEYEDARKILTRVLLMSSIFDDMYDAYATLQELKLFTEAVQRWSYECLVGLPEYMQIPYRALLQLYEEIAVEMIKKGKRHRIFYAKEAMKIAVQAYYEEAIWRDNDHKPTFEEYMDLGTRTAGIHPLLIASYLGMGNVASKEHFEWALEYPFVIRTVCAISRLINDIMGHEFEQKRKHVRSAVDCYMKDHGVTKPEAIKELKKEMEGRWKDMNECLLRPREVPAPLLMCALNFVRIHEVIYKDGDLYTHVTPEMQSYINQLLEDPIPFE